MTQQIRMWEVGRDGATIQEVEGSDISLEKQLEDWLESDISLVDADLLVIGRQVETDFRGKIDLLCMDSNGDLVVVEVKRGKLRREAVAQALDYASWAKDLSREHVCGIAQEYYGDRTLDTAFQERFDGRLPDVINDTHRSLIVGESTDADAERMVRYLSDLEVPVNMATVYHFTDQSGRQLLASAHLVDQDETRKKQAAHSRRRRPRPLLSELERRASESGIGDAYNALRDGLHHVFRRPCAISNDIGFQWRIKDESKKDTRTTLIKVTPESIDRTLPFEVHVKRCEDNLRLSFEQLKAVLPQNTRQEDLDWRRLDGEADGLKGSFGTVEEVEAFTKALKAAAQRLD